MTEPRIAGIFIDGRRPYIWIALVGIMLYSATFFFGLTYLDDNILIIANQEFIGKLSNVVAAFRQDVFHVLREYDAAYRPILTVSFMADAQLDRLFRVGYHFSNIVFHLIASCLVFLFFLRLKWSRTLALFFALVFTVHPALTQAVAWIPGRNDSLLGIFVLASLILMEEYLKDGKRSYLLWHLALFLLAIFTKEAALALLPAGILYSAFVMKRRISPNVQARLLGGWGLAIALWYILRGHALSHNPAAITLASVIADLERSAPAILSYLGKAIFPLNLSVIPAIEDTTLAYGIASAILIAAGLAVSKRRRSGFVLFGAAWYLLFIMPTFIRPMAGSSAVFLESRMYLPILGIFIVLGEIDAIKSASFGNKTALFFMPAVIGLFFCMSAAYSGYFRDETAFWEYAVKGSPHSSFAQYNLGWVYNLHGRADEAVERYRKALELNPRQRYAHNALGNIYESRSQLERAAAEYSMEIINTPYYAKAYRNLAGICYRQGDIERARKLWGRALQLNPDDTEVRRILEMVK